LTFLGLFAMLSLSPRSIFCARRHSPANAPRKSPTGVVPRAAERGHSQAGLSATIADTSYWLGEANEMAAINTILIIVNRPGRKALIVHEILSRQG
jgi:hypothetical protein